MEPETEDEYIDRTVEQVRFLWDYLDFQERLEWCHQMRPVLKLESILEVAAILSGAEER